MKRVIVTGAGGFIGTSLVNKLVKNGVEVLGIDVSFERSSLCESESLKLLCADIGDTEALAAAIGEGEYDAFYHLAWKGVNGADKADPIVQLDNAKMTLGCAKLAKSLGVKKLLCAGTVAEQAVNSLEGLSSTSGGMMYGSAKRATQVVLETYCKNVGLDFVWMQFSNIYGPQNKTGNLISYTLSQLLAGNEATFGPALQPYDFIYVEDLIEAIYRLGEKKTSHCFYFIGSGSPRLLKDYLFAVGRACGREDLIKVGVRGDDGIKYQYEMFDTALLKSEIGEYVSMSFEDAIKYTIENY